MRKSAKRQRIEHTLPPSTDVLVWESPISVQTTMLVDWIQPWKSFGKSASGALDGPIAVRLGAQGTNFVPADVAHARAARRAKSALNAYIAWYEAFVATYECDLRAKAITRPGRLRQARVGLEKLRELAKRITISSDEQTAQFERILNGYMQMGQYTTEPGAKGALIPVLVNDVVKSLSKADLIAGSAPQTLTPTVRPALIVDPQQVIAA